MIREQLLHHLAGHGAHITFDAAVDAFPVELAGRRVPNLQHTAWGLLYHLWICQKDMVAYVQDADHESPPYPSGLWPKTDGPAKTGEWDQTIRRFRDDQKALALLVSDPDRDLFAPLHPDVEWCLLQQVILVVDHNSYHVGQLVDLRMLLGAPVRDW